MQLVSGMKLVIQVKAQSPPSSLLVDGLPSGFDLLRRQGGCAFREHCDQEPVPPLQPSFLGIGTERATSCSSPRDTYCAARKVGV